MFPPTCIFTLRERSTGGPRTYPRERVPPLLPARRSRRRHRGGDRACDGREGDALSALPVQGRSRARIPEAARAGLDAMAGWRPRHGGAGRRRRSACSRSSTSSTSGSAGTTSKAARLSTLCSRPPTATHPVGRASAEHLANIRGVLRSLAGEAGLRDTEEFARSFHILMKGSIVQACEGDPDAAKLAQAMARGLIEEYRRAKLT